MNWLNLTTQIHWRYCVILQSELIIDFMIAKEKCEVSGSLLSQVPHPNVWLLLFELPQHHLEYPFQLYLVLPQGVTSQILTLMRWSWGPMEGGGLLRLNTNVVTGEPRLALYNLQTRQKREI